MITPKQIFAAIGIICAIVSLVWHREILLPIAVIFTGVASLL